jgi:nucleoside diphosphate kinase
MPEKIAHYQRDVAFREGIGDAAEVWCDRLPENLRNSTILMIKPDGLAAGLGNRICDFLESAGFNIVAAEIVSLAGQVWRSFWRFQLTAAHTDRFLVNEILYRYPALVLLLRDAQQQLIPASVRLAERKGSSDPTLQRPGTLRALLEQRHRLFTYVHTPDEPADVLRELAVLTERARRLELLSAWQTAGISRGERIALVNTLTETVCAGAPPRSFAFPSALAVVEAAIAAAQPCDAARTRLRTALSVVRAGGTVSWREFLNLLDEGRIRISPWDLLTFGAYAIEVDAPGAEKLIGSPNFGDWERRSL